MKRNWFLQEYRAAWRTLFHFAMFCFLLGFFSLPLHLLGLVDEERHPVITTVLLVVCLLVYLPFGILWASRMSGVQPPTEEQADRLHREAIAAKNAELKKEACTANVGPSGGRA
jgi:hypothetical protein